MPLTVRNCHSTVNQSLYLVAAKGWVLAGRALCSWVSHGQNNAPPWCADLTGGVEGSIVNQNITYTGFRKRIRTFGRGNSATHHSFGP